MTRKLIALFLLLIPFACHAQRLVENACDGWSFNYVAKPKKPVKGIPACTKADFDDSSWKQVSVPHTWQTYETTGELHPFIASPHARDNEYWWTGTGFYRKAFRLSGVMDGRRLLEFLRRHLQGGKVRVHTGNLHPLFRAHRRMKAAPLSPPGTIRVRVEADGLKGAEIEIKAIQKTENKCITY